MLDVRFTKYSTCAAKKPGEGLELSRRWTGFFFMLESETYLLQASLRKNGLADPNKLKPNLFQVRWQEPRNL